MWAERPGDTLGWRGARGVRDSSAPAVFAEFSGFAGAEVSEGGGFFQDPHNAPPCQHRQR